MLRLKTYGDIMSAVERSMCAIAQGDIRREGSPRNDGDRTPARPNDGDNVSAMASRRGGSRMGDMGTPWPHAVDAVSDGGGCVGMAVAALGVPATVPGVDASLR